MSDVVANEPAVLTPETEAKAPVKKSVTRSKAGVTSAVTSKVDTTKADTAKADSAKAATTKSRTGKVTTRSAKPATSANPSKPAKSKGPKKPATIDTATASTVTASTATTATEDITTATNTGIHGELTGLYNGYLQGWVYDANNPDLSLVIEVCFDGVYGQLARADEFVMHAPRDAQMHGFNVELKAHWLANAKRVSARVANQGPWLSGSIDLQEINQPETGQNHSETKNRTNNTQPTTNKSLQAGSVTNTVTGSAKRSVAKSSNESANRVYYAGGLKLVGWCLKDSVTGAPKTVRVVEGEQLIASVTANQYVGFLSNRLQQGHGFEIDLPWSMADGKRHELEVLDDAGEPIKGSPVDICLSQTSQASVIIDAWQAAGMDSEPPSALLRLIETHERVYPPSFGFEHYPYWYCLYQMAAPYKPTSAKVAVLVIADPSSSASTGAALDSASDSADMIGASTGTSTSIDSVFMQRLPAEQVECLQVTPAGILKGLEEAANCADLVVPLWAGDQLSPHAVDMMVQALSHGQTQDQGQEHDQDNPQLSGWGYCDHDTVSGSVWAEGSDIDKSDEQYSTHDCAQDDDTEDHPEEVLHRSNPWLKPDWDETLFFGVDYVSHGVFLSSAVVKDILSKSAAQIQLLIDRDEPDSVWNAFLACVVEKCSAQHANRETSGERAFPISPVHLQQVLYHRSEQHQQTRNNPQARYHALAWLADQRCPGAKLLPVLRHESVTVQAKPSAHGQPGSNETIGWRVVWPMPQPAPLVSVIVPTRNGYELLQTVIDGLLNNTDYPNFEVLVVDNDSDCPQTLAYLDNLSELGAGIDSNIPTMPPVRVLRYPYPFNYAAINNFAAKEANGELLLLLNNDIEITDPRWMSEMVVQFQRGGDSDSTSSIGVVGKKLLWPNGMVQHGGVVVGINGLAAHAFNNCQDDDLGYMGLNRFDREQSAVTAACLMISKSDYWAVGGLDAHHLPVAFNDVDLCLKIRQLGKKIVLTTRFPLIHHESATRGKEDTPQKLARAKRERDYFMRSWMPVDHVWTDPYYHPGLNHDFVSGPYGGLGRMHGQDV